MAQNLIRSSNSKPLLAALLGATLALSLVGLANPASASTTCVVNLDDATQNDTQQIAAIQAALGDGETCTVVELVTPVGVPVEVFFAPAAEHLTTRRPLTIAATQETVTFRRDGAPNTVRQEGGFIAGKFASPTATGTLRLENLIFAGARAVNGGAVYSADKLHLENTQFIGNNADSNGGAAFSVGTATINSSIFAANRSGGLGGALRVQTGGVDITSSQFTDNVATTYGGAVSASANSVLNGVMFSNNEASFGGAVWINFNLVANNTDFVSNSARGAGPTPEGGAAAVGGNLTMVGGSINDNKSEWLGSGRAGRGGGMKVSGDASLDSVEVLGNTSTGYAGGLYVNGRATITASRFLRNSSWQAGGAILVHGGFDISGSEFVDNSSEEDGGYVRAEAASTITDSVFDTNRSPGAGVIVERFVSTTQVSADVHRLTIERSVFTNNRSTTDGPAVRALAEVHIFGSSFTENTMTGSGAGAVASARGIYASMSSFINNEAAPGQAQQFLLTEASNPEIGAQRELALQGVLLAQKTDEAQSFDLAGGNLVDLGGNVLTTAEPGFGTDSFTGVGERTIELSNFVVLNPSGVELRFAKYVSDSGSAAGVTGKQQILDAAANTSLPATFQTLLTDISGSANRFVDLEGNTLDAEVLKAGALQTSYTKASAPIPYVGPVVSAVSDSRPQPGGTLTLIGSNLSGVSRVMIGGAEAQLLASAESELEVLVNIAAAVGSTELILESSSGRLSVQGLLMLVSDSPLEAEGTAAHGWTRAMADGTVKFYARDLVGAGKVRFMLNGREIAWVRAVDASDPKLNVGPAAARDGLVRTVGAGSRWSLVAGRNVLEIWVGENRLVRRIFTQ